MDKYIINRNTDINGNNEVHNKTIGCRKMPLSSNQISLGEHRSAQEAVNYAKSIGLVNADGCYYCCNSAHKG